MRQGISVDDFVRERMGWFVHQLDEMPLDRLAALDPAVHAEAFIDENRFGPIEVDETKQPRATRLQDGGYVLVELPLKPCTTLAVMEQRLFLARRQPID